ncbi:hypothetical protein LOK49_LG03G02541 [Camellia lanceoleosa]|uniref:Uncharacterized protein n=1 Tax=Camellia lanceoleosa TaxID=1840588 RepID=A0ACC0IA98_9ERIC|nr:hypothetical protein LOK49_LG03G02541 [Camellia lanceoleosa]
MASPLPLASWNSWSISPAEAVLYSPGTKVHRTGELALRKAIPANTNMKAIQDSLEDISYLLRIPQRKPYGTIYVIVLSSDPYVVVTPGQQVSHTTATSLLSSMAMKSTSL